MGRSRARRLACAFVAAATPAAASSRTIGTRGQSTRFPTSGPTVPRTATARDESRRLRAQAVPIPRQVVELRRPLRAGHDRDLDRASAGSTTCSATARRSSTASASAARLRWSGTRTITMKREWPDWRPPAQMLTAPPRPAALHGGRLRQPARRPRHVSRRLALPHPRLERAGDDRPGGVLRLHPHDQRGRVDLYSRVRVGTRVVVLR